MNLILKLYLIGILFNLVVFAYQYYRGRGMIEVHIKGVIGFILASWLVYTLVLMQGRRY